MNSPFHAPSSSASSSSSSSSHVLRPPPCLTHASRNLKYPLLLPQTVCTYQKKYRCFGAHIEASFNIIPLKNYKSFRSSPWWSEAQSPVSNQSLNKQLFSVGSLATSTSQDVSDTTRIGDDKIGVLLLNLGGPETLEDVQPFLFNLFSDPDIIRLPRIFSFLQKPLAQFVSVVRAPKSKEGYASIGGGSPLRRMTDAQAEDLRKSLWEKNVPAKVYVGMRYWHPFTEEAIEQIKRDGITKLVVLPLYPQFSISTSGSSLRLLENIFRDDEYLVNMQHTVIPSWYQREGYIKAMANLIEKELKSFDCPEEVMIFFSAHGVPLAYVEEAGDPYKVEMEECVDLIMEELETRKITNAYTLAYQFYDLLNIFELNGLPSEENPYLFNGDFVDRGSFSLEVILTLFAFKCMSPSAIYLARGNHESKSMNKIYGFEGEVRSKLNDTFVELFAEVFCFLPLAHVINEKVFVVHGGLFSVDGVKLSDIRSINRFCEPPEEGLMCEILWSDPQPLPGRGPSKRGVGLSFGPDVTEQFLQENNLDLVVRSHEVKDEGYEIEHDGKLITVFSAPNYCDQMGNKGAFIRFEAPDLKPNIVTFSAVPHPDVKPMAYANNFLRMFS